MRWFSKKKRDKPIERSSSGVTSSVQHPVKCLTNANGYLICPGCNSESSMKASEVRRWLQEQELEVLICPRCGTFLTLS